MGSSASRQTRRQNRRKSDKLLDRWNVLVSQRNIAVKFVIPEVYEELFNAPDQERFDYFLDSLIDGIKKVDDKTPKLGIVVWAVAYYKNDFDQMCEIIEERLDKSLSRNTGMSVVILPMAITKSITHDIFDEIFNRDIQVVEEALLVAKLRQPGVLKAMLGCWKRTKNNYHRRRSMGNQAARKILMSYQSR